MQSIKFLTQLTDILEKLGIELRMDVLGEKTGGLCKFKNKQILIIDKNLSMEQQAEKILEALHGMDLSGLYLPPAVRQAIEGGSAEW